MVGKIVADGLIIRPLMPDMINQIPFGVYKNPIIQVASHRWRNNHLCIGGLGYFYEENLAAFKGDFFFFGHGAEFGWI